MTSLSLSDLVVYLSGFSLRGRDGMNFKLSHFLSADVTFLFCKDLEEQLCHLNWYFYVLKLYLD